MSDPIKRTLERFCNLTVNIETKGGGLDELLLWSIKDYEKILGRVMLPFEIKIYDTVFIQLITNTKISALHEKCLDLSLRVSNQLTKMDGDCLFEALTLSKFFGVSDPSKLRTFLSSILWQFRDYKEFLQSGSTLREIFDRTNEIKCVYGSDGGIYEYTYEVMCIDVSNKGTWSRLPTELLLLALSNVFNIDFVVVNDLPESKRLVISAMPDDKRKRDEVFLGHILEEHYVYIERLDWDEFPAPPQPPSYRCKLLDFKKWLKKECKKTFAYSLMDTVVSPCEKLEKEQEKALRDVRKETELSLRKSASEYSSKNFLRIGV